MKVMISEASKESPLLKKLFDFLEREGYITIDMKRERGFRIFEMERVKKN